jgi:hypothetical protein
MYNESGFAKRSLIMESADMSSKYVTFKGE